MSLRLRLVGLIVACSSTWTLAGMAQDAAPPVTPPTAPSEAPLPPSPRGAGIEPTSDQRALAETLFYAGRGLMEDGKYTSACKKFAESYRLDPAEGTLLNLAVCHEKEGKIASSWGEFREAIGQARRARRPDREQLASAEVAKIEPDLPFLTIEVPRAVRVPGLLVKRNGIALDDAAWDTELPIDPGTNEITVSAPGYKPETKLVTIDRRQHLRVVLDPLVLAPIAHGPPPFWTGRRAAGGALVAGGVVAAGVGALFGVLASNNKSKSDQGCTAWFEELRCGPTGSTDMSTAQTDAWIADIGIGVGAVAIVTGAVLMITGGGHAESGPAPAGAPPAPPQAAAWGFRFTGDAHGGGGLLTRSF